MWNVRYVWMHSLRHFQGHQGKSTRLYINIIRCWSGQLNSQLLFNPQPAPWQINAPWPRSDMISLNKIRLEKLTWVSEGTKGGRQGWVRRLRGVFLEGEEIERGYTRWPKATHRGRRPPAREASVPAPQGPRRRAAERLELLVNASFYIV